jgi:Rad3-related DNA helicase
MKRAGRMRRGLAMDRIGFPGPFSRLVKHRFDHCPFK